jgi:hypothetical protein
MHAWRDYYKVLVGGGGVSDYANKEKNTLSASRSLGRNLNPKSPEY